jgi:two-component system chemotaxis response regulator CheY
VNDPSEILKRIKILVVDDMDSMLGLISATLKTLGVAKVVTEYNGLNAWNTINKGHIDLIISDWDMPQMNGLELLKLVKESDTYKHLPFLLLTASTEKQRVLEAVEAGVSDYLAKPFTPKELEYRVIKLLRKVVLSK